MRGDATTLNGLGLSVVGDAAADASFEHGGQPREAEDMIEELPVAIRAALLRSEKMGSGQ